MRSPCKTNWDSYSKDLEKFTYIDLNNKPTSEIDKALTSVTSAMTTAMDKCTPKIRHRTLPHPKIDNDLQTLLTRASRLCVLAASGVNYKENKRRLTNLRQEIVLAWTQREAAMWGTLITKTNMERDPKIFWEEIHRLMGHKKTKMPTTIQNEHNHKLTKHTEIAEAFRRRLHNTFRLQTKIT